ncbi:MAG TPA: methionyl-tRNA formyltransferase [Planctomycetota bacterium]|nr:methionyl-tRNA formyltransferase [Planctomycetota bacterium]
MRILFLGNHTVGVRSLDALARDNAIVGVVAHPEDPEDGVRYQSVYDHAAGAGLSAARFKGRDPQLERFVRGVRPDLLWIADYRYLLPQSVLDLAPLGAVNLHPSLLPNYRGRAAINWAILRGERQIGLTAHFIDEGVDTGDIIAQKPVHIAEHEDVGDALDKLYPIYESLSLEVVAAFRNGNVRRTPQPAGNWPIWPRRSAEDGLIDWSADAQSIVNLIRAVARPYPGAFSWIENRRVTIWKARAGLARGPGSIGSIWRADGGHLFVNCGEGSLQVLEYEMEGARRPRIGDRLDPMERAA